ncbi:hypothetical protein G7Y89_g11910 [Cudoniella acicularis]|uniref:FAD-binding PCMH-type domain-containing protein n=1 Tax=Cudoniella acicularis TaxID=354080 RepID=A0A8H4VZQ4_9HELO|nr:hypothetical protein G7Y89_g11910 [Cudoniella acicularis]
MTAPNALTIWVHNILGITVQTTPFTPTNCPYSISTPSLTFGAGEEMAALNLAASQYNLTIISGGQTSIGYNGYMSGAGHGALGPTYGMAADNVLEMEVVTPSGEILTVNECQNQDLFWALRGGGGSTFGVITRTTIAAFPSVPLHTLTLQFGTPFPYSDTYWSAAAAFFSSYPSFASNYHLAGYGTFSPNTSISISANQTGNFGGFAGVFLLPAVSPSNTTTSLEQAILPIVEEIQSSYPGLFISTNTSATYPSFYDWWITSNGPDWGGIDLMVGSRLLDAEALSGNLTALKEAMMGATTTTMGQAGLMVDFVSGVGVWDAKPRGGGNSVNPAWRRAVVHCTNGATWPYAPSSPSALTERTTQQNLLTNTYVQALRTLAPNMGAYVNEADVNEPDFQKAFWGTNYERLVEIKRSFEGSVIV